MGGMGSFMADTGTQFGMKGLASGIQTGSSIAHAEYNANALRAQADSLRQQSGIQAYMIRNNYRKQYQQLLDQQTQQQSMNRAIALKRGITGASAAAVLGAYAAKGQKNLDQLYYNAAMQTAQSSIQHSNQVRSLEEKARQYDWQARSNLIGGIIGFAGGLADTYAKVDGANNQKSPVEQFDNADKAAAGDFWDSYDIRDDLHQGWGMYGPRLQ